MYNYKLEIETIFKRQEVVLKEYLKDLKGHVSPEDTERQLREQNFNCLVDTLNDGFDAATSIISTFTRDPKAASHFQTLGSATIKIATSMYSLIDASSGALNTSLINPYVGLTLGVCSLIGLFQDSDDLSDLVDIIQDFFIALSEQMYEYHQITMSRFDALESQIDLQSRVMLRGFFNIHQQQEYSIEQLVKLRKDFLEKSSLIQNTLTCIEHSLTTKYSSLTSNLEALRKEKINEIVQNALNDSDNPNLSARKLEKHINNLYTKATIRCQEPYVTGGNVNINVVDEIGQALTTYQFNYDKSPIMCHPAYNNINLIRQYLTHTLDINIEQLPNPLLWVQCVDALISVLQKRILSDKVLKAHDVWFGNNADFLLKIVKHLYTQGTHFSKFMLKIYANKYVQKVSESYKLSIVNFIFLYNSYLSKCQQDITLELRKNYEKLVTSEIFILQNQKYNWQTSKRLIISFTQHLQSRSCKNCKTHCYKLLRTFSFRNECINNTSLFSTFLEYDAQSLEKTALSEFEDNMNTIIETMKLQLNEQSASLYFDLYNLSNSTSTTYKPFSMIIYPDTSKELLPILPLPKTSLPIPQYYIIQERQNRGEIRHEYSYDNEFFHIKSYFLSKLNNKILILHMNYSLNYKNSPYPSYEHVQHNWYGGYFAKQHDVFKDVFTPIYNKHSFTKTIATAFLLMHYGEKNPGNFSCHLPPFERYDGLIHTWHSNATIVFKNDQICEDNITHHIQQKINFNDKIIEQLNSNTLLRAALHKIDAEYKLIDGLLALAHNNNYSNINFIKNPNIIKDERSFGLHCVQYPSLLAHTDERLSNTLNKTLELVDTLISDIEELQYKPLPDLQNILDKLDLTLHMLEAKSMNVTHSNVTPTTLEQKDSEINMLRQEVQQSRDEIKELTNKLNLLLQLVTNDKK